MHIKLNIFHCIEVSRRLHYFPFQMRRRKASMETTTISIVLNKNGFEKRLHIAQFKLYLELNGKLFIVHESCNIFQANKNI